ncbi:MAG: TolC family protein [Alphaproteobacteria bacterium]|nr:TolC family protein [Alphaproteobacteria bacterium]
MVKHISYMIHLLKLFSLKPLEYLFFPIFLVLHLLTRLATLGLVVGLVISIAPFFNESLAQEKKAQEKTHPDDLPAIVQNTFVNSLEMLIANENEINARELKKQAFYRLFPQLSLTAVQNTADQTINNNGTIINNSDQETTSQTLKFRQTLLGSGAPSYSYVAAKSDHQIALQQLRLDENNILLQIINSYTELYTAQKIKQIADTNLVRLQQHYNATKQRQRLGSASLTQLKQAEAQLENARANAISAEGNMITTQASFEISTGIAVSGVLPPPTIINQDLLPSSLEDTHIQAEAFSPNIKIALQQEKKAKALKKRSGLPLVPNIAVEIGQTTNEIPNNINGQTKTEETFLAFQLSYNITPGQALSARRQALSANRARGAGLLLARRNAHSGTIIAWQNYVTAKAVLNASNLAQKASESAFEGTKKEYDLGRRSQLELLDAQETWLNAEQSYHQAFGRFINAHYRLLANSGHLAYSDFKN